MNTAINNYRTSLLGWNVFDDIFNSMPATWLHRTTQGYPVADIYRNDDNNTVMEFALAGFTKEDLDIEVKPEKNTITVSAATSDEEDAGLARRIARRSFNKTYVNYDTNLDLNLTTAEFENGLLRLVIPQRPEAKPLAIDIK